MSGEAAILNEDVESGLEVVPPNEEEELVISDRDEAMESIVARSKIKRKVDLGELPPEALETPPETEETDDSTVSDDEVQNVELNVLGETVIKTQEEVDAAGGIAAIQKDLAGDAKLEQAAKERKQLEQERTEFNQRVAADNDLRTELTELKTLIQTQKADGTHGTDAASEEIDTMAKDMAAKFFVGEVDDIEEVMKKILTVGNQQAPAAQAVAPVVDEAAIAMKVRKQINYENDVKEAVSYFEKDNADLNKYEGRRDYVDAKTAEIMRDNPTWSPKKVMVEAVKVARVDLHIPAPSANTDGLADKRNRKGSTVDRIPSASRRVAPPPSEKKPTTRKEAFAKLSEGRSHNLGD